MDEYRKKVRGVKIGDEGRRGRRTWVKGKGNRNGEK